MMLVAIIVTEVLITLKFDWETFTKPLPQHIALGWVIGLVGLALWTVWHFYLQRLLTHTEQRSNGNGHQGNTNYRDVNGKEIGLNTNTDLRKRKK
jgi:multisubunit Na+/H+ antiporter MnhB subunit